MMKLGSYTFSIDTAAYRELSRAVEHRWSKQDLIDRRPGYQYVGPGEETIKLPGSIFPQFKGDLNQLDAMRSIAEEGEPKLLIDSRGRIYGRWAIRKVEEKTGVYLAGGIPRRVDFSLDLVYVDDGRPS